MKHLFKLAYLVFISTLTFACKSEDKVEPTPEPVNEWKGKKIVWTGTSIPWSFGTESYPNQIGRLLEANVINNSISGSAVVFFPKDTSRNIAGCAGMAATREQLLQGGFPWQTPYSYMDRILVAENPDLVVIDHGQNDISWIESRMGTINGTDIGTFYGAMNTIINETKKKFPKAKILLTTPVVIDVLYFGSPEIYFEKQRILSDCIRNLAKAQSVELWDLRARYGIRKANMPALSTDGLHPTKLMVDSLAKEGYKFLVEELKPAK